MTRKQLIYLSKAIDNIKQAIKYLDKANDRKSLEDVPYYKYQLIELLNCDNNQAGLEPLAQILYKKFGPLNTVTINGVPIR